MKVSQWTHNGFAVVVLDNRGSANRGTKFESYIQVIVFILYSSGGLLAN